MHQNKNDPALRRVVLILGSGGGGGTRTPDLYSAIVALSQLSYAPSRGPHEYTDSGDPRSKREQTSAAVDCGFGAAYTQETNAGVTQLVEYLLPKQAVAGSSPVPRSTKTA
jgi:hypothetical protein